MRISSVRIENFRSFDDEKVPLNSYACLVGPNGAGKSTVLTALNVFFRESENLPTDLGQLVQEDFHRKHTDKQIQITVTFTDLDDEAQEDFSDYVRQGQLVVSAVATFDGAIPIKLKLSNTVSASACARLRPSSKGRMRARRYRS